MFSGLQYLRHRIGGKQVHRLIGICGAVGAIGLYVYDPVAKRQSPLPSASLLTLPDGRRVSYAEYGAPTGRPVFALHSIFGCRLDIPARQLDRLGTAAKNDVRIIALDRPGYGLSDLHPKRTITDYPNDIIAAANALGLDKFGVITFGDAAVYGLACAAAHAADVSAAAASAPASAASGSGSGSGIGSRLQHVTLISPECSVYDEKRPAKSKSFGESLSDWVFRWIPPIQHLNLTLSNAIIPPSALLCSLLDRDGWIDSSHHHPHSAPPLRHTDRVLAYDRPQTIMNNFRDRVTGSTQDKEEIQRLDASAEGILAKLPDGVRGAALTVSGAPAVVHYIDPFRESMRVGVSGVFAEMRLTRAKWPFEYASLAPAAAEAKAVPISVWHGKSDSFHPVEWTKPYLEERLPARNTRNGTLIRVMPGAGHLSLLTNESVWKYILCEAAQYVPAAAEPAAAAVAAPK